ncbi:gliding motility-associated C-terminal domain-containing protein [Carboxylicivirga taeanensis]|uniref:T9SS type B sorting domain-containing protein n=1 Tax=Carboxylicivirga taeanensis TaxID=1416875 RepID=UPI003F6DD187
MKKNLLILLLLLLGAGVANIYGQYTAEVSYSQERFCENEKDAGGAVLVTVSIQFSPNNSDGVYSFEYLVNGAVFSVPQQNGDTWSQEFRIQLDNYIEIREFYFVDNATGERIEGVISNGSTTIVIDQLPDPLIDPQVKTCRKEVTLSADPGGPYTAIEWFASGDGSFLTSDREATFYADVVGDYNITYQVTNGACTASDMLPLTITEQATPSATFQLQNDRVCSDQEGVLLVTAHPDNRFDLTLNYSDGTNQFSQPITAENQALQLAASTTTTFTLLSLVDREGCNTVLDEAHLLTVDQKPQANAGFFDQPICGDEVLLNAQLSNLANTGSWSIIESNGSGLTFVKETEDDTPEIRTDAKVKVNRAAQLLNESYTLRWTEVNNENKACSDFDDLVLEFDKEPVGVSIGNDTTVYLDKEITLEGVNGLEGMPLRWDLPNPLTVDDSDLSNIVVGNLQPGDNAIKCIIENGVCPPVVVNKLITVNDLYQTTGFSPNGDGVNDTFRIGGAQNVRNNSLVVFDVTGKVVYETRNFMVDHTTLEGWDGYQNNGELKDGTFYYVFSGEGIEPVKNYLIIKGSK